MYAICNVILGWPLNTNGPGKANDWSEELENAIEDEQPGFIQHYRGSGEDMPTAFGVELCEFDECAHHTFISDITLTSTREQETEIIALFNGLTPSLRREIITKYGLEPRIFILWTSS